MRRVQRRLVTTVLAWLALGAIWTLNSAWPLHAPPHHEALLDWIIGIGAIVGKFLFAFGGASVAAIIRAFNALRRAFVELGRTLQAAIWEVGKRIARAVRAFAALLRQALPKWLQWAYHKILKLEAWLKQKFAPLVNFLRRVRDELNALYKKFVRPIIDTIEFIRQLNRVLEFFHIHVLQSLDRVLAEIESRIDQAVLWLYSRLTIVENWIDKIITLDGLFQRLTLLRSLERDVLYQWRILTNARRTDYDSDGDPGVHDHRKVKSVARVQGDIHDYLETGGGEDAPLIQESTAQWRQYFGAA